MLPIATGKIFRHGGDVVSWGIEELGVCATGFKTAQLIIQHFELERFVLNSLGHGTGFQRVRVWARLPTPAGLLVQLPTHFLAR